MKPDCIHCSRHLRLVSEDNYSWQCEAGCNERIDTGIPTSSSITSFQRYAIHNGGLDISRVIRLLLPEYVSGARVYMPQIIYHFIECTWGGCYNHLYLNCIAPYLDSPAVVDYVLRSPVVYASADATRTKSRHTVKTVFCVYQESNADCRSIANRMSPRLPMSRNDSPKNRAQPVKI